MATDNQQTRQITTQFSLDARSAQSHTLRSHQLNEVNRSETNNGLDRHCEQRTGNTSELMMKTLTMVGVKQAGGEEKSQPTCLFCSVITNI